MIRQQKLLILRALNEQTFEKALVQLAAAPLILKAGSYAF